jgi:Protein of unknown function (DUF3307)
MYHVFYNLFINSNITVTQYTALKMFITLIGMHYLGDFALQSDYMASNKGKNLHVLVGHCMIHAMLTFYASVWQFALLEFISHFTIDSLKCKGKISFNTDQFLHLGFKVLYIVMYFTTDIGGGAPKW